MAFLISRRWNQGRHNVTVLNISKKLTILDNIPRQNCKYIGLLLLYLTDKSKYERNATEIIIQVTIFIFHLVIIAVKRGILYSNLYNVGFLL